MNTVLFRKSHHIIGTTYLLVFSEIIEVSFINKTIDNNR